MNGTILIYNQYKLACLTKIVAEKFSYVGYFTYISSILIN